MSSPFSIFYPALQWLARATVRRDARKEFFHQQRLRRSDPNEAWDKSFQQAVRFANLMAEKSPAYHRKLVDAGFQFPIDADPRVWRQLPTLIKDDFRKDSDGWYNLRGREREIIWTWTSGSTGEPFKFPLSRECHVAEMISQELYLRALGWKPWWKTATIKVEPKQPKGMRGWFRKIMGNEPVGFAAAEFRMEHVPRMANELRAQNVKYLRGYATSVFLFADEMVRRGLFCSIPLITTLGEGLTEKQAEIVERAFGGNVYRDYGGSEAMHIGYQCREQRSYHVDLSRFYIEIMSGDRVVGEGERGEIVITHFRNDAMPLVRYRMGDIGEWERFDRECSCGNRMPMIKDISGRTDDVVVTGSGHVMNVPLLVVVFEYAQEHIAQFKVVQIAKDQFDVLWVSRHDRASQHIPQLNRELVEKTGGTLKFSWKQVNEIPPERSGKRRILVPLKTL